MPRSKRALTAPFLSVGTAVEFVAGQPDRPARYSWRLSHRPDKRVAAWGGVHRLSRHSYRWWAFNGSGYRSGDRISGTASTFAQARARAKAMAGYRANAPRSDGYRRDYVPDMTDAMLLGMAGLAAYGAAHVIHNLPERGRE